MSRTSSTSNSRMTEHGGAHWRAHSEREVFRWTQLRNVGNYIYSLPPSKALTVLGSPAVGSPMVLAANGLICVGTDAGRILVFDFKQTLKCICGSDTLAKVVGPVTALALSHDHTYVASGHTTGHVQLFDLNSPQTPARAVAPTPLAAVSSGRREGHLPGSRIVSIGFVAGRHTAVVSADDHGLAFYHSLGKVLFVEASDTLRILGQYPQEKVTIPSGPLHNGAASRPLPFRQRRTRHTILAMAPLPLGSAPHATDVYNVVALLTATKLVVVGLKPTPRTWFKCPRQSDVNGSGPKSRSGGTMSWWPSVLSELAERDLKKGRANGEYQPTSTMPMLVYSWGNTLNLIGVSESKIMQPSHHPRTGKPMEVEIGTITYQKIANWNNEEDILAVQWLNANQIVVLTAATLDIYDARLLKLIERVRFDVQSLVSPSLSNTVNGAVAYADSVGQVAHSIRVYKGKIFLLGREELKVGTLLTWADRILSLVQDGDFLSAIHLTRFYYVGEAPGNKNGLPDDPTLRQQVIGEKMRDLMAASARYAFSEDRMSDGTHNTLDGRGVDRTSFFEGLVSTCARASVALDDFEFFFEDLFQQYDDAGISRIFLKQLEPFVLDGEIRYIPPRVTQCLVAMHQEDERPDLVERIIWHIDPECLDINQAILLCQKHSLYDALIYIYTCALRDYVSPVVELLGHIRKVNQYRKSHNEPFEYPSRRNAEDLTLEASVLNACKIYPYLADILSGLTYPSEVPLDDSEASQAKKDVYNFLFSGRSSVWPLGEGGRLVFTSDEDSGMEPTYPYARLLLRFDAESFLHTLDIAFEDLYDETQGISRLVIVKILLEISTSSTDLLSSDITLVNIFVARNVAKYPQFIQFSPTALHDILIDLAEDSDQSTREDRQLAAEYLLSVYTPHESTCIQALFEKARFYRILRSWHRHERQWAPLILTYLNDPELRLAEVFDNVNDVLNMSAQMNKGVLPPELLATISDALPRFMQASVTNTASLMENYAPEFHQKALDTLAEDADHERFMYLRYLLEPVRLEEDDYITGTRQVGHSSNVPKALRHLYISLQCRYHPNNVIQTLEGIPSELLDWSEVMQICENNGVYDAVVWASNTKGDPRQGLSKAETLEKRLTFKVVKTLSASAAITTEGAADLRREVSILEAVGRVGISICLEHSQGPSVTEIPLEDIWFQLLSSQISCVQHISGCCALTVLSNASEEAAAVERQTLESDILLALRSLVQDTFGALVSISSTRAVSFPRLFKRLVETATRVPSSVGTPYTEFRTILTGMLESYRSDGDMLIITKHLVDRDLFQEVERFTRERIRGWTPSQGTCLHCRKSLLTAQNAELPPPGPTLEDAANDVQIVVSRTGAVYHSGCLPS